MSKIWTYIGLHFKLSFRKDKKEDVKSSVITIIMGALTCAVLLVLCYFLFSVINEQILQEVTAQKFSVLIVSLIEVVLIVVGVFLEIKFFLKPNDVHITARFPLSSVQLFISQLLIVYFYLFAISFLLLFPIMMIYGASIGIISFIFVLRLFLTLFLAPLVPFAVASLFVIPTMFILTKLESKNILKLVLFLILLAVGFFLYSRILNFLADYYVHQHVDAEKKNLIVVLINSLNNGWNFLGYPNNLIYGSQILKSLGVIFAVTIVVLTLGILASIPLYSKTRENILEGKQSIFSKKTQLTKDSAFSAIFKNEFKNIIRTHTYAYFYLGVSIITPVMVFLTNMIIQKIGTAQVGSSIVFGVSLLIVLVFMSMINSFSASAISREGKEFYITKIIPVSYKKQLLAKGLLNAIVSTGALIISLVILCSMNFISVLQGMIIFIIALLLSVGIIFNGFNINVRNPSINKSKVGEESQTNTTIAMLLGFVISAIEGLIAIVLSFFINLNFVYLLATGITLIYFVVNVLIFNFTINKKYAKIE